MWSNFHAIESTLCLVLTFIYDLHLDESLKDQITCSSGSDVVVAPGYEDDSEEVDVEEGKEFQYHTYSIHVCLSI